MHNDGMMRIRSWRWLAFASLLAWAFAAHASALHGFDQLERSLRLNPAQRAQFDTAVAATQRALVSVALGALQVKDRLAAELAKPKPDLSVLVQAQDEIVAQSRPLFQEARREWERLYAMLDPDQVERVKAYVEARLDRLDDLGAAVRDLLIDKLGDAH